ncbi:hypothetical protein BO94DRAFT_276348 [Aspergillus sclerotioniger CBS 115572]|uniref:Uncharacterized protein n=1 Tax=Aspergillus sclerotioniger CBS 115572 TaxID=1450535 RepID=A0A317XBZ2_9EURO|nr:hypothetical protein BO94DRAFT_276348 [Aspergillus sclerotioniger CBS 115572]PWY94478.1 hypothetical protein BO94DRAFT_276348 [Aspergillus sclerotioniger CBS 115572]
MVHSGLVADDDRAGSHDLFFAPMIFRSSWVGVGYVWDHGWNGNTGAPACPGNKYPALFCCCRCCCYCCQWFRFYSYVAMMLRFLGSFFLLHSPRLSLEQR